MFATNLLALALLSVSYGSPLSSPIEDQHPQKTQSVENAKNTESIMNVNNTQSVLNADSVEPTDPVELWFWKKKGWGGCNCGSTYSTQYVQPSASTVSVPTQYTVTQYVTMPGYVSTISYQSQSESESYYTTAATSTTTYPPVTVGTGYTSVFTLPGTEAAAAAAARTTST